MINSREKEQEKEIKKLTELFHSQNLKFLFIKTIPYKKYKSGDIDVLCIDQMQKFEEILINNEFKSPAVRFPEKDKKMYFNKSFRFPVHLQNVIGWNRFIFLKKEDVWNNREKNTPNAFYDELITIAHNIYEEFRVPQNVRHNKEQMIKTRENGWFEGYNLSVMLSKKHKKKLSLCNIVNIFFYKMVHDFRKGAGLNLRGFARAILSYEYTKLR